MLIKTIKRNVVLFTVFILVLTQSIKAQESSPLLWLPADTRSAGMGEIILPNTRSAMLYSSLGAIFLQKEKMYANYSLAINPKSTELGRQQYHNMSVGYRFSQRNALFLGTRFWKSAPVNIEIGSKVGKITSKDRSLDVGYAFALQDNLSLYTTVSYINSYNTATAHILLGNIGVSYNTGLLYLDLAINNIGTKYHYGKDSNNKISLPTSIRLSGDVAFGISENQTLNVGATINYNINNKKEYNNGLNGGLGVEYDIKNIVAIRTGATFINQNSRLTLGVGRRFGIYELNLAYNIGKYTEMNMLNAGLNINI